MSASFHSASRTIIPYSASNYDPCTKAVAEHLYLGKDQSTTWCHLSRRFPIIQRPNARTVVQRSRTVSSGAGDAESDRLLPILRRRTYAAGLPGWSHGSGDAHPRGADALQRPAPSVPPRDAVCCRYGGPGGRLPRLLGSDPVGRPAPARPSTRSATISPRTRRRRYSGCWPTCASCFTTADLCLLELPGGASWSKPADQIIDRISRYSTRISGPAH
jgi:hypothetical protein